MQVRKESVRTIIGFPYQPFKKQAGKKPEGEVIKADELFDMPLGMAVIPGAQIPACQKGTGKKFTGENEKGIDEAPYKEALFTHNPAQGGKERGHAIDGEHPDGSIPGQPKFPPAEGIQGSKCNFKTPAEDAAMDKVMD